MSVGLPSKFVYDAINPFALLAYAGGYADCERAGGFCPDLTVMAQGALTFCIYPGVPQPPDSARAKFVELLRRQKTKAGCGSVGALSVMLARAFPAFMADMYLHIPPQGEMELVKARMMAFVRMATLETSVKKGAVADVLNQQRLDSMASNVTERDHVMKELMSTKLNALAFAAYIGALISCAQHGQYCPMISTIVDGIAQYCVTPPHVLTQVERAALGKMMMELMKAGMQGGGWGMRIGCATLLAVVLAVSITLAVTVVVPVLLFPVAVALIATIKDGDGSTVDRLMSPSVYRSP